MRKTKSTIKALDLFLSNCHIPEQLDESLDTLSYNINAMPLLSWDLFMSSYQSRLLKAQRDAEQRQLLAFINQFNWKNDFSTMLKIPYEALILTDKFQNIIWVNNGFKAMTGYNKSEAINKTPRFLQGKHTCMKTKDRIRTHISNGLPFKERIVNHKKNGNIYTCEVQVFPLYNKAITHFIAFERQVS